MKRVKGILEIDADRGVIYFTSTPAQKQQLRLQRPWLRIRICQLPRVPDDVSFIDITAGTSSYTLEEQLR